MAAGLASKCDSELRGDTSSAAGQEHHAALVKVRNARTWRCDAGTQFLRLGVQLVTRISVPADNHWGIGVEQFVEKARRVHGGIAARIEINCPGEHIRPLTRDGSHQSAPTRIGVKHRLAFMRDWLAANSEASSRRGRYEKTARARGEGGLHRSECGRQYGRPIAIGCC
jgi:hypothetical protein